MKKKLQNFMIGRYGVDELNRFLMVVTMVFVVLNILTRSHFLYWGGVICLIISYWRMLSKNIRKRFAENQKFLHHTYFVRESLGKWKSRVQASKTHHIYRCPACRQKIRIPRGKGKISIHCPKCHTDFIKNS